MATVLDLTDDPLQQQQLARNMAQPFATGIANTIKEGRRIATEQAIVSLLSQSAAEGWTPEQTRLRAFQIPGIIESRIGQAFAAQQVGDPLAGFSAEDRRKSRGIKAGIEPTPSQEASIATSKAREEYYRRGGARGGAANTRAAATSNYFKWQADLTAAQKALSEARIVAESNGVPVDKEQEAQLTARIARANAEIKKIDAVLDPGAEVAPQVAPQEEVDAVTRAAPRAPSTFPEATVPPPELGSRATPVPAANAADKAIAKTANLDLGPPAPYAGAGEPEPRSGDITQAGITLEQRSSPAKPKTQEEFEATVRRMGNTRAARGYYDKWVSLWQ